MNNVNYKSNQTVQPLYDFYCETDLDSLDDQPVDYSKRYTDQDSYEERRRARAKCNVNSNQFPTSERSQIIKPGSRNYSDEVKVYCIEGTPVTISSASSFCDLREVGIPNSLQKSGIKRCLPSTNGDGLSEESLELKKSAECYDVQKDQSITKDKDEINKEVKSVTFRDGEDISKASSPLMFSRSSSVCSLNSFEQHSIIDDRSSVSAISALTSGIISPSDLPDSPGEVMSPVFTDKACSPKIDSSKVGSDNEGDDMDVCEKDKIVPGQISDATINNPVITHVQLVECEDYVSVPSNKPERNSEDDNDILAQQLDCLHNSSTEMDEVFVDTEYESDAFILKSERDSVEQLSSKSDIESDEEDELLQHYIQLGMPNKTAESKYDMKRHNTQLHAYLQNASASQKLTQVNKETEVLSGKPVVYEREGIITPHGSSVSDELPMETNSEIHVAFNAMLPSQTNQAIQNDSSNELSAKFDGEDSDEDDILLQQCIQLGMPKQPEQKVNPPVYKRIECHDVSPKNNEFQASCHLTSAKFVDEDSDGDDVLVQQCIQLGMPKKTEKKVDPAIYKSKECHHISPKNHASQSHVKRVTFKSNEDPLCKHQLLNQHRMQYTVSQKVHTTNAINSGVTNVIKYASSVVRNRDENVVQKPFRLKSEGDSDGDEDDILLKKCIELGMPKDTSDGKGRHSKVTSKPVHPPRSINMYSPSDLRDNRPDGISDGDEEDDLMAKCIRAGMPRPKITKDAQNRQHNSPVANTLRKLQPPTHSYLPSSNSDSSKNICPRLPSNQPYAPVHLGGTWLSTSSFIDVDCMRIYRTEDTPVLSPSASISDLSSLSFNESFLNNSRNSDCSSESDDDELLRQCIRSGMPVARRAVA